MLSHCTWAVSIVESATLGRREQAHGCDNEEVTAQGDEPGIEAKDGIVVGERKSSEDEDTSHDSCEDGGHGHAL